MLLIAHRGCSLLQTENTLPAFQAAIDNDFLMIEFDVQHTKENVLIIYHDYTLERLTKNKDQRVIQEMTLNEIKKVQLLGNAEIPTLHEVWKKLHSQIAFNIEIKTHNTAKLLIEFLRAKEIPEDLVISSFITEELTEIRNVFPQIKIGVLIENWTEESFQFAQNIKAYSINFNSEYLDKEWIDKATSKGFKTFSYTVNIHSELQSFKDLGVNGIFTDNHLFSIKKY